MALDARHLERRRFWVRRLLVYNGALVASCVVAGALMFALQVAWHFFPVDPPPGEEGLPGQAEPFSIFLAPFLFGIGMLLANLCYLLGPLAEIVVRPHDAERFRKRLFALGLGFSVLLPLAVPSVCWWWFFRIQLYGVKGLGR